MQFAYEQAESPAFIIDESRLVRNLELIEKVQEESGVEVILALKGFANWSLFPLVKRYLAGATASSLHEARLIFEEMGCKAHTYSPAYFPSEMQQLLEYSNHISFNSLTQLERYKPDLLAYGGEVSVGLRVNPEYSEVETDLYNPAIPGSRLGVMRGQMPEDLPDIIEGLHVHTLCESSARATEALIEALENKFAVYFKRLKWINLGGGHLMTRDNYDLGHLIQVLKRFRSKYPWLKVILEPGSAIAWETGELLSTVLDIVESGGIKTAILDVSFTAHMPDTLEMPYRPQVLGASEQGNGPFQYRLGGVSCLAGDFMEVYGFPQALSIGDRIIFWDMIHYTMVKTTMFNGVKHPAIYLANSEKKALLLSKAFTYSDFKNRLG